MAAYFSLGMLMQAIYFWQLLLHSTYLVDSFRTSLPTTCIRHTVRNKLLQKIGRDDARGFDTQLSAESPGVSSEILTKSLQVTPYKIMVFIDGTWLFYSLIQGRDTGCPVRDKFGKFWESTHKIHWNKLEQLIAKNINHQISLQLGYPRIAEVIRTYVFTSTREDTSVVDARLKMISDFQANNFEVHHLTTHGPQEKCVDISLAVEMLYMATVPDAYDIAVIITGDKDFMPAMKKTRLKAKRVALCSMRNSCNRDLTDPREHIRDFDVIWLDDNLDILIREIEGNEVADLELIEMIKKLIEKNNGAISSRDIGRGLQVLKTEETRLDALTDLKSRHKSLRIFLEKNNGHFTFFNSDEIYPDFLVSLAGDTANGKEGSATIDQAVNKYRASTSSGSGGSYANSGGDQSYQFQRPPNAALDNADSKICRVFVAGFPIDMEEEDFKNLGSRFGHVVSCNLVRDLLTRKSKGYGFIDYVDAETAMKAIAGLSEVYYDDYDKKLSASIAKLSSGNPSVKKPLVATSASTSVHPNTSYNFRDSSSTSTSTSNGIANLRINGGSDRVAYSRNSSPQAAYVKVPIQNSDNDSDYLPNFINDDNNDNDDDNINDYEGMTVIELKERLRERELPTTGVKSILIARLKADIEGDISNPR